MTSFELWSCESLMALLDKEHVSVDARKAIAPLWSSMVNSITADEFQKRAKRIADYAHLHGRSADAAESGRGKTRRPGNGDSTFDRRELPENFRSLIVICRTYGVGRETVYDWIEQGAPISVSGAGKRLRYSAGITDLREWLLKNDPIVRRKCSSSRISEGR